MSKKGKKIKRLKDTVKALNDKVEIQKELIHWQRTENAKLRELMRYMWDVALHPETFGDGSYLLKRMRELGIEVK